MAEVNPQEPPKRSFSSPGTALALAIVGLIGVLINFVEYPAGDPHSHAQREAALGLSLIITGIVTFASVGISLLALALGIGYSIKNLIQRRPVIVPVAATLLSVVALGIVAKRFM